MRSLGFPVFAILLGVMLNACTVPDNEIAGPDQAGMLGVGREFPDRYTFETWVRKHPGGIPDPAIILSFSGGFLHAAALANGVLKELENYEICVGQSGSIPQLPECRWHRLLDHVVIISSTSGGSFANANFVANGPDSLESFDNFLLKDLKLALLSEVAIRPWTWLSALGPVSNRSRFMIDLINETILPKSSRDGGDFKFKDLSYERPFAIFGATDYAAERHFIFTQESFDDLCSDLSKLPVAEAVTASGAFPFLLTDVELKSYWSDGCPLTPAPPFDPTKVPINSFNDKQEFLDERYADSLRRASFVERDPPVFHGEMVLHLLDGGIADNLAVRPLMRLMTSAEISRSFRDHTILYIQVNARSDPATSYAVRDGSPWLWDMATAVPYASLDNDTALSNYAAFSYWNEMFYWDIGAGQVRKKDDTTFARSMYIAEVDYDQDPDRGRQAKLKEISGTSLSHTELTQLYNEATYLLPHHPCFQAFLKDMPFMLLRGAQRVRGDGNAGQCSVLKRGEYASPRTPPALLIE